MSKDAVKVDAINLSWKVVLRILNDSDVSDAAKLSIAMKICERTCPQEVKFDGKMVHVLADRLNAAEQKYKVKNRLPQDVVIEAQRIAQDKVDSEQ